MKTFSLAIYNNQKQLDWKVETEATRYKNKHWEKKKKKTKQYSFWSDQIIEKEAFTKFANSANQF